MGITLAILILSGITPVERDKLIRVHYLMVFIFIPSKPGAFPPWNVLDVSIISHRLIDVVLSKQVH